MLGLQLYLKIVQAGVSESKSTIKEALALTAEIEEL